MDFYNRNFHQLIRHVDPDGMLNVPMNIFTDSRCLQRFFRTNNDFRKMDVTLMCEKLIVLLTDYDETVRRSSSIIFLRNDFQRLKYPFILLSQAFFGLIIIYKGSINAYCTYCKNSTIALYKTKIILETIPIVKKRKRIKAINQPHQDAIIPNQSVNKSPSQNQVVLPGIEENLNEDVLLVSSKPVPYDQSNKENLNKFLIQPVEEFEILNQNLMDIDDMQPKDLPQHSLLQAQQSIELPQCPENILEQQNQEKMLMVQPIYTMDQNEQPNQIPNENDSAQNNLINQPLKRKKSSKVFKRVVKKRPIEQSNKVLQNRLERLEGELPDRPLEYMAMKYLHHKMDHLPVRYAMHRNILDIIFTVVTLNLELKENEKNDDIFNNLLTMNSYKNISENLNHSELSNSCIYQQSMNNSLPHLSLVPLVEECLTNNSLVWRGAIDEINKNLEASLKDVSPIYKIGKEKWEEFKEKMKHRVSQSLVTHKTLIHPEVSRIDTSQQPVMLFPSPRHIDALLNDQIINVQYNSTEVSQINKVNICEMPIDIQFSNNLNNLNCEQEQQNNMQEMQPQQPEPSHRRINVVQLIREVLEQCPEKKTLIFTDLCPIRITNRKYAISAMLALLGLHKEKIVRISQPFNIADPSSISIELKNNTIF